MDLSSQLKPMLSIEKLLFATSFLRTVSCSMHPATGVVSPVSEHYEGGGAGQEGAGEPEGQARGGDEDQGGEVGGASSLTLLSVLLLTILMQDLWGSFSCKTSLLHESQNPEGLNII